MSLIPLEKLVADLVAIPSVNPMGRAVSGPEYLEHKVTDYLEQLVKEHNLPYYRQPISPGRDNLIIQVPGARDPLAGGKLLMFEAHQDTVPVEGMTIPPWLPTIRDGRLYGRGSCDIKGGLGVMLYTLLKLHQEQPANLPTIVLACTVNEEYGFTGAKGLVKCWQELRPSVLPRQPDAIIVTEPTSLNIVVAHRGMVRWRIRCRGRAAHSSLPELGDNAIYRVAPVLLALKRYQQDIVPTLGTHPLCGRPTINVGTIKGGISVNTVPDECVIEIDRRLLPGDDPQQAYEHVVNWVTAQAYDPYGVTHDPPGMTSTGLSDAINGELARDLAEVVTAVRGGGVRIHGVSYGTDAAAYGHLVPTIVFGPGSIDQAHTVDEWVPVHELHLASEILYRFSEQFGA
jgi:acetylornithine deacetylase